MSTRLYVGNVAAETTEDALRELFATEGRKVETVSVVTDRETGRPRGFCFVQMSSPEEATAAIAAVNGREIDGHKLTVSVARVRAEKS